MGRALSDWFHRRGWAQGIIAISYVWLLFFFLLPFVIVLAMSFATRTPTAPPSALAAKTPSSIRKPIFASFRTTSTSAPS